jgi:hypothetical protein
VSLFVDISLGDEKNVDKVERGRTERGTFPIPKSRWEDNSKMLKL